MGLSVTTIAASTRLTTRAAMRAELGASLAPTTDDSVIDTLIDQASAAILHYCNRPFARQVYSETVPGFRDIRLLLQRSPVVKVASVADYYGSVITDATVDDPNIGSLYRRVGWWWTTQSYQGLGASGSWMDHGTPLPGQDEAYYAVAYTAGYILPEQNITGAPTISASAADNSFNDSASGFPASLVAGDVVLASQFTNTGNNGRHVVSGTPTAAKIVVTSTLTTEAAAADAPRSLRFLPPANVEPFDDVEKACIETAKSWYQRKRDDAGVVEKQVGGMRIRRGEQLGVVLLGIPPLAVALLRPWRRAA